MQIPSATYRIQFSLHFRFADAQRLVPYLHALGISHLYSSPHFQARKGSLHGYDVADPLRLNQELGTEEEFKELTETLAQRGMGLLLDIVPNHMAASGENPWWMDVLERGRESVYASYFDINWDSPGSKFPPLQQDRLVLPNLSDFCERMVVDRKITLRLDGKGFFLDLESSRYPVDPKTYPFLLDLSFKKLPSRNPSDLAAVRPLQELREAFSQSHTPMEQDRLKADLWKFYQSVPEFRAALDATIEAFCGSEGDAGAFDLLNGLLSRQPYRLAYWRNAGEEVNYRRFFGLNDLVALRIEDPEVFRARHARTFGMIEQGMIVGLRIDYIDGLRDPLAYLQRLQEIPQPPGPGDSDALKIYTVVEKITSGRETLPPEWPTAGTTGYDYLNAVNTLFIDAGGSRELEAIYREFTGIRSSFVETWNVRKKQVMEYLFASEVRTLSSSLGRLAVLDRLGRDIPMRELVRGLKEITASLPIYRTYCRDLCLSNRDRGYLERAFKIARVRAPVSTLSDPALEFLRRVFLLAPSRDLPNHREEWLDFLLRWQQFTGAVMAKGLEDTAFFVHHGLISLNEVGCNPLRKEIAFGVKAFHHYNQRSFIEHPFTLNATSTHDTKWSEDVRARINVLSEVPAEWKACLDRWSEWNQSKKSMVDARVAPSPNEEILLYQSLLGVWPVDRNFSDARRTELRERLENFILKAAREAKTHSSWVSPNQAHENALRQFVSGILDSQINSRFLLDFAEFAERIAPHGACNAWSQVLLKVTSPGVPDFFQGNELWNSRLTDPDNRNPVDFNQRARLLAELERRSANPGEADPTELLSNWRDGRLKLYLTREALNFRRGQRELFLKGEYLPLETAGEHRNSVCAFARRLDNAWALVAIPRLTARLSATGPFPLGQACWGLTTITLPPSAPSNWKSIFTQEPIRASWTRRRKALPLAVVFAALPFALLVAAP